MKNWIAAARLRTLPLSVSGIIMGSFIAKWRLSDQGHPWNVWIFVLAIVVTLMFQILSNFANDYGDGIKGTDIHRVQEAETRLVASGKITPQQMKKTMIATAVLAFITALALLYITFLPDFSFYFFVFLFLGLASIASAIGYTVGKKPYGYMGLGDLFVFIFFGFVSVLGSYFLFTKTLSWDMLLPATAIGMMSVAVLNLNNMRDIETDKTAGKNSFALRIGYKYAMVYEIILLQIPILLILLFLAVNHFISEQKYYAFIVMILLIPLTKLRRQIMVIKSPKDLDPFLKQVGIITFLMAVLLAAGLSYY